MEIKMSFGEGTSPFVYKDSLIVNWDQKRIYLYRLNAKTGEAIWKVERMRRPPVITHCGGI